MNERTLARLKADLKEDRVFLLQLHGEGMQADELIRIQKEYLEIKWGRLLPLENATYAKWQQQLLGCQSQGDFFRFLQ